MYHFIILFIILLCVGCDQNHYPKYELIILKVNNDSIQAKKARFITETCKSATFNLKTEDYEDVDDMVREVTSSANRIFSHEIRGLRIIRNNQMHEDLYPDIMTEHEKQIYNSLMNK